MNLRSSKGHRLKYKMAGTPIIGHVPIRWRRIVRHFGLGRSCGKPNLPLTKTGETRELNPKEENQPDEEEM